MRETRAWLDELRDEQPNQPVFLFDIRKRIESRVLSLLRTRSGAFYETPASCMAFPVGVNKNQVAAHYSPCEWEHATLDLTHDSVSIDFGLFEPTTGVLTDGAFTWNAVDHSESAQLTQCAQEAVDAVIRESGPDAILGELGATC